MILELSGRFGFAFYLVAANRCRSSVKCQNRCVYYSHSHQHYVPGQIFFFFFYIAMIFYFPVEMYKTTKTVDSIQYQWHQVLN